MLRLFELHYEVKILLSLTPLTPLTPKLYSQNQLPKSTPKLNSPNYNLTRVEPVVLQFDVLT